MKMRVLIVEDEPPIQRSIIHFIELRKDAFEVVGTAMNGKAALEFLQENHVDVIFTDIRMPVMDGLTMVKQIRAISTEVAIVIISGYQDFDYLQQALRSRVQDYLLKPITTNTMTPVLDQLQARHEIAQNQKTKQLLEKAVGGTLEEPLTHEDLQARYTMALFCAGAYPLADNALLPGQEFWRSYNLEEEIETKLEKGEHAHWLTGKTPAERVLLLQMSQLRAQSVVNTLWKQMCQSTSLAISVAPSQEQISFESLNSWHKRLRKRLYKCMRLLTSQCLQTSEAIYETQSFDNCEQALRSALHSANSANLQSALQQCLHSFKEAKASEMQFVYFLENIFNTEGNLMDFSMADHKQALRAAISNATNEASLIEDLAFVFSELFTTSATNSDSEPQVILAIEQYLQQNYAQSITTSALSEKFGFVPSYISKLFRQHRGVSPSEYITQCRIQKAKLILQANPNVMVKEVASAVGFNDQYYFSKIFKKETGVWPSEYQ